MQDCSGTWYFRILFLVFPPGYVKIFGYLYDVLLKNRLTTILPTGLRPDSPEPSLRGTDQERARALE